MLKLRVLILTLALIASIGFSSPTYAESFSTNQEVQINITTQSQFNNFQKRLEIQGIHSKLLIVDNVQTTMSNYARNALNKDFDPNSKSILFLVALERKNKLGFKPAIRVEGQNFVLSQSNLDSILNNQYYPTLNSKGFYQAFQILLNSIEQNVAPKTTFFTPPIESKSDNQKISDDVYLIFSTLLFVLLVYFTTKNNIEYKEMVKQTEIDRKERERKEIERIKKSEKESSLKKSNSGNFKGSSSSSKTNSTESSGYSSSYRDTSYSDYSSTDYSSSHSSYDSSDSGSDGGGDCGGGDD
jgi:hypothetical protein